MRVATNTTKTRSVMQLQTKKMHTSGNKRLTRAVHDVTRRVSSRKKKRVDVQQQFTMQFIFTTAKCMLGSTITIESENEILMAVAELLYLLHGPQFIKKFTFYADF